MQKLLWLCCFFSSFFQVTVISSTCLFTEAKSKRRTQKSVSKIAIWHSRTIVLISSLAFKHCLNCTYWLEEKSLHWVKPRLQKLEKEVHIEFILISGSMLQARKTGRASTVWGEGVMVRYSSFSLKLGQFLISSS